MTGKFRIIVLTSQDNDKMQQNISFNRHLLTIESTLLPRLLLPRATITERRELNLQSFRVNCRDHL